MAHGVIPVPYDAGESDDMAAAVSLSLEDAEGLAGAEVRGAGDIFLGRQVPGDPFGHDRIVDDFDRHVTPANKNMSVVAFHFTRDTETETAMRTPIASPYALLLIQSANAASSPLQKA